MKYQKLNNIITLSGESVQSLQLNYLPLSVKVLSSREAMTLMSLKKEYGNVLNILHEYVYGSNRHYSFIAIC